jgi:hypothetical protein
VTASSPWTSQRTRSRTLLGQLPALALCALWLAPTSAAAERRVPVRGHFSPDGDFPAPQVVHQRAPAETLWFGGEDPVTGLAVPGEIWDFDDGTLQGWTSIDRTDLGGPFFTHVTADSHLAHGDPTSAVISPGGSTGSIWCGAHEDFADSRCWPGGQGYGNLWRQFVTKGFGYDGTGDVTIEFDYFADSETGYDFTYVYVVSTLGVESAPLNTSDYPNEDGYGYSGSNEQGSGIGSPSAPAHQASIVIPSAALGPAGIFAIKFECDSDPLISDQLDPQYPGFLNSWYGPFGADNIHVSGSGLDDWSDFEPSGTEGEETDGWTPGAPAPVGRFLRVADLDDLQPPDDPCFCPLSEFVMLAADPGAVSPHPGGQYEELRSNVVDLTASQGGPRRIAEFVMAGHPYPRMYYDLSAHYYPWTCPSTGAVSWTVEAAYNWIFPPWDPFCGRYVVDLTADIVSDADSLRLAFRLIADYDASEVNPWMSPYLDQMQFGVVTQYAPWLAAEVLLQDAYPQSNSLLADATANIDGHSDNNYSDADPTNADLADSANVIAPIGPGVEVYLNFRVHPGPAMEEPPLVDDPWWTRYGGDCRVGVAPEWVAARMDSSESASGVANGEFMTFLHEEDPRFTPPEHIGPVLNEANEILPDGFFTPGTTIEYFFTVTSPSHPDVGTAPDTSGGLFYEVEILPGYRRVGDEIRSSCVLYVDAYNFGAQLPNEEWGLRPYLGQTTDDAGRVRDNWDRYDYLAAGSNVPAPLAREFNGNNGMTRFQSMIYRTVYYDTGDLWAEGLRNGDADLFINFLTNPSFDRWSFVKGLWLSGNGIAMILDRPGRPAAQTLLTDYMRVDPASIGDCYREIAGDPSFCVRLDAAEGAHFPAAPQTYAALRGNGCPTFYCFQIVQPLADGRGNLVYVDQDAGEIETSFAGVSNDQSAPGNPMNYRTVLDAFSTHYMRTVPDGWTGGSCGTDSSAIGSRFEHVLDWLEAPIGVQCEDWGPVQVDDPAAASRVSRTRLLRNAPNPLTPTTRVRYELAGKAHVTIQIFDVRGALVGVLADGVQPPGRHEVEWDGRDGRGMRVPSGVYWVRMSTSEGYQASTKLVMLE